jgi:uncharacterized protein YjiS (DUF1127 family)
MTYQDFGRFAKKAVSAPFNLMAAIGRGVEGVRLYEALQRLSDRDLAAMGITRDGIAQYVAKRMEPETLETADVHAFAAAASSQPAANETTDHRRAA